MQNCLPQHIACAGIVLRLLCRNSLQVWGNWEHVSCRGKRVAYDKYEVRGGRHSASGLGLCLAAQNAARQTCSPPCSSTARLCLLLQVPGDGTVTNIHVSYRREQRGSGGVETPNQHIASTSNAHHLAC